MNHASMHGIKDFEGEISSAFPPSADAIESSRQSERQRQLSRGLLFVPLISRHPVVCQLYPIPTNKFIMIPENSAVFGRFPAPIPVCWVVKSAEKKQKSTNQGAEGPYRSKCFNKNAAAGSCYSSKKQCLFKHGCLKECQSKGHLYDVFVRCVCVDKKRLDE